MLFNEVFGQEHLKNHLIKSADEGRIPHAQLFVGPEGSGTLPMAIAYAQYIILGKEKLQEQTNNNTAKTQFGAFLHPDLHYAFPVTTNDTVKKHPVSKLFFNDWIKLLNQQPYCNLFDWLKAIGIENKQGQIGVDEASEIVKSLSLKSYEGGYKVLIIWMAEKMNTACSNKLLKLIEEPPEKTVILLVAESEDQIITTIKSRCQILHFPVLPEKVITDALVDKFNIEIAVASNIARQSNGNFNKACDLVYNDSEDQKFEEWFVFWVRSAFKAKGNKSAIHDLINWSEEIAKTGRETQKEFLNFCLEFFRQALLLNYNSKSLVYYETKVEKFDINKFAPFVHENNITDISSELQNAIYHIERNGNAKIILTDLSIKLTRLLHKKAS